MKFLVDAQLPRKLCAWLRGAGHDVRHTLDLPLGNRTPDSVVLSIAAQESLVVVTKDDDFLQSHLIAKRPEKLLLIATGNISNTELQTIFNKNLAAIVAALEQGHFVELNRDTLTLHD